MIVIQIIGVVFVVGCFNWLGMFKQLLLYWDIMVFGVIFDVVW